MIKVFYIEDNNGQYVSADGSKRWTRLTGQALYDFLQTERGKKTYFVNTAARAALARSFSRTITE